MKIIPLLLAAMPLLATVNQPLRIELFSGYRNDRIHWHLQNPGEGSAVTYSELYRDVQFWENGLDFDVISRDLLFHADGSYAAFGKGTLFQKYPNRSFTSEIPTFQFSTDGWAADGTGYVGYAVNLTADRTYKVIVVPLVGYSGHFEHLQGQGVQSLSTSSYTMESSFPAPFELTWYGVLIGLRFMIEPGGRLSFQGGYMHHWLHQKMETQFANTVSVLGPSTTVSKVKANDGANLGQSGWIQMACQLSQCWRIGLGAEIRYFSTRVLDAKLNGLEQKYKLRETTAAGWLQLSREF